MIVGRDMTARRMAPLRAFRPLRRWKSLAMPGPNSTMPRKPTTTEGMPARISTTGLTISRTRPGDVREVGRAAQPDGDGDEQGPDGDHEGADDHGQHAVGLQDEGGGVPDHAEEAADPQFTQGRQPVLEQDEENAQQDQDGQHAVELKKAVDGGVLELPPVPVHSGHFQRRAVRNRIGHCVFSIGRSRDKSRLS